MYLIGKPDFDLKEVYLKCTESFRDIGLVTRLSSCTEQIVDAANVFEALAEKNEAFKMVEEVAGRGSITAKELIKMYTQKFSKKGSVGRPYYDRILLIPKDCLCPMCGVRGVSTIDHYLPKSVIPSLAIAPSNLLPSCWECNITKNDEMGDSHDKELIHPYFDDISSIRWLVCDIIEGNQIIFKYSVSCENVSDVTLYKRLLNHFEVFELGKLFKIKAANMFSGIEKRLKDLYNKKGARAVKHHIQEDLSSYEHVCENSWQSAFYRGLLSSDWFYEIWLKENSTK